MAVYPLRGPFTVDDYHRLGELGILHDDDRVELIDGQVVEMTPIGPPHSGCVNHLTGALSRLLGETAIVSVQNPVVLGRRSEPEPDLAVLRPRADSYRVAHPRGNDVLLLIEVADASAKSDRDIKIPLYAAAAIPEIWLVDLQSEAVEVYRNPTAGSYVEVRSLSRGATITALEIPQVTLSVGEILG